MKGSREESCDESKDKCHKNKEIEKKYKYGSSKQKKLYKLKEGAYNFLRMSLFRSKTGVHYVF